MSDDTKTSTRTRAVTAGLSAVGAGAGIGGLAYGAHDMAAAVRAGKKIPLKTKALVPLEVAGLGGELMATKILHRDVQQQKKQGVLVNKSAASQRGVRIGLERPEPGEVDKALLGKLVKPAEKVAKPSLAAMRDQYRASLGAALEAKGTVIQPVKKAGRRFDPEADRQRRLGAYSGLAAGGALVAGDRAAREVATSRHRAVGGKLSSRHVGFKPGRTKTGLLLGGAAVGLGALAAGSYRRGVSERNQPWS
jgi:hypothetical protein